ncbi:DUF3107 domain-containing protein [Rhodococcus aerolatus]
MEVKIGVAESPRELVVNSGQAPDEVESLVNAALEGERTGVLALTDDKGRRYLLPASRVSYVEIGPADPRRVGFSTS